jgi:hypothetical protein
MSHAHYDGFCFNIILNDLHRAYHLKNFTNLTQAPPYSCFISHVHKTSWDSKTKSFWADLLQGSTMTVITPQPEPHLRRVLDCKQVRTMPLYHSRPGNATFAIVVKAAWSIILSYISGTTDVVFGSLVFGRDPLVDGIADMVGACINIVPNRVHFASQWTIADLLKNVKQQQVSIIPFETTLLRAIGEYASWPTSTRFGSIVQHQNIDESIIYKSPDGPYHSSPWSLIGHASYPGLCDDVVDCWITTEPLPQETRLYFEYNSTAIPDETAANISQLLCDIVDTIYTDPTCQIRALQSRMLTRVSIQVPRPSSSNRDSIINFQKSAVEDVALDEPQHALIIRLRELWAKVLPLSLGERRNEPETHICDDDASFFVLGGDSFLAMQLAVECKQEGLVLNLQDVFDFPTRRLQAARLLSQNDLGDEKPEEARLVFVPRNI